MTDQELTDAVDWLFSGRDQDRRDDMCRDRVQQAIKADDKQAIRVFTAYVARMITPPSVYTIEDVMGFVRWLDYAMGWV